LNVHKNQYYIAITECWVSFFLLRIIALHKFLRLEGALKIRTLKFHSLFFPRDMSEHPNPLDHLLVINWTQ